jgi:hypothetical protein
MNKIEQAVVDTGGDWGSIKALNFGEDGYLIKSTPDNDAYDYPTYLIVDSATKSGVDDNEYWTYICTKEEYEAAYAMMNRVDYKPKRIIVGNLKDALIQLANNASMNISFYADNTISIYDDCEDISFEYSDRNVELVMDYLKAKEALEEMQ